MNANKVKVNLVEVETKVIENITFNIKREIKDGFILKHISFSANDKDHFYTERVKYLDLPKMISYFKKVGFMLVEVFGDYNLSTFDENTSDRLILIAK